MHPRPSRHEPLIRRWLHRLPLRLHRAGIRGYERLLGIDWIVLTTRGRRSGRPHVVMVDEIGHDAAHGTIYVAPANGRRSDWVRNVLADSAVIVERRGVRFLARARAASGEEGARIFLRFVRGHPRYARLVAWLGAFDDVIGRSDAEVAAYFRGFVVIALSGVSPADGGP